MKISKKSYSLALIPLTGMISLAGTPIASAAECSTLSPCVVVNSVPAVSALPDVLANAKVKVTVPRVQSVTAPVAPAVDSVTAPVKAVAAPVEETINKVTAPAADVVKSVVTPITPIVQKPIGVVPEQPVVPITQPSPVAPPIAPVEPVTVAAESATAENVTPADTKSVSKAPATVTMHDSAAVTSGGLDGAIAPNKPTPSLVNFQPAAVHSTQGAMTKFFNSGAFGFGHLNPVDDPVGFTGLVFAYITVLGSAIGFAIKRSAFLNFRGLA